MCEAGWSGHQCQSKECDPRCLWHGQCKSGTCLCVTGWNGRHCTLEGCPGQCSGNGECRTDFRGDWSCNCRDGWDGEECSTRLELACDDGIDNDGGRVSKSTKYIKSWPKVAFKLFSHTRLLVFNHNLESTAQKNSRQKSRNTMQKIQCSKEDFQERKMKLFLAIIK